MSSSSSQLAAVAEEEAVFDLTTKVKLTIIQGKDLAAKNKLGPFKTTSDPYVEVWAYNVLVGTTSVVIKNHLNPVWSEIGFDTINNGGNNNNNKVKNIKDESFHMTLEGEYIHDVQLKVFNWNRNKSGDKDNDHDPLGVIPLKIEPKEVINDVMWLDIPPESAKDASGSIQIKLNTKLLTPVGYDKRKKKNKMKEFKSLDSLAAIDTTAEASSFTRKKAHQRRASLDFHSELWSDNEEDVEMPWSDNEVTERDEIIDYIAAAQQHQHQQKKIKSQKSFLERQKSIANRLNENKKKTTQVKMTIFRGKDLAPKDRNLLGQYTGSDPYVEVWFGGDEYGYKNNILHQDDEQAMMIGKTETMFQTLNPVWTKSNKISPTFTFQLTGNQTQYVQLKIWDYDQFSDPDLMGIITIPLNPPQPEEQEQQEQGEGEGKEGKDEGGNNNNNNGGKIKSEKSLKWYEVPKDSAKNAKGWLEVGIQMDDITPKPKKKSKSESRNGTDDTSSIKSKSSRGSKGSKGSTKKKKKAIITKKKKGQKIDHVENKNANFLIIPEIVTTKTTKLQLTIFKGINLVPPNVKKFTLSTKTTANPYVEVWAYGHLVGTTKKIFKTLEPSWIDSNSNDGLGGELFNMRLWGDHEHTITLKIYHEDSTYTDEKYLMGITTIVVKPEQSDKKDWYQLLSGNKDKDKDKDKTESSSTNGGNGGGGGGGGDRGLLQVRINSIVLLPSEEAIKKQQRKKRRRKKKLTATTGGDDVSVSESSSKSKSKSKSKKKKKTKTKKNNSNSNLRLSMDSMDGVYGEGIDFQLDEEAIAEIEAADDDDDSDSQSIFSIEDELLKFLGKEKNREGGGGKEISNNNNNNNNNGATAAAAAIGTSGNDRIEVIKSEDEGEDETSKTSSITMESTEHASEDGENNNNNSSSNKSDGDLILGEYCIEAVEPLTTIKEADDEEKSCTTDESNFYDGELLSEDLYKDELIVSSTQNDEGGLEEAVPQEHREVDEAVPQEQGQGQEHEEEDGPVSDSKEAMVTRQADNNEDDKPNEDVQDNNDDAKPSEKDDDKQGNLNKSKRFSGDTDKTFLSEDELSISDSEEVFKPEPTCVNTSSPHSNSNPTNSVANSLPHSNFASPAASRKPFLENFVDSFKSSLAFDEQPVGSDTENNEMHAAEGADEKKEEDDPTSDLDELKSKVEYFKGILFNTQPFQPQDNHDSSSDDDEDEEDETIHFLREEYKRLTEKKIALLCTFVAQNNEELRVLEQEAVRLQVEILLARNINERCVDESISFLKNTTRTLLGEIKDLERSDDEQHQVASGNDTEGLVIWEQVAILKSKMEGLRNELFNTVSFAPLDGGKEDDLEMLQFLRDEYKELIENKIAFSITDWYDVEQIEEEVEWLKREVNKAGSVIRKDSVEQSIQFLKHAITCILQESSDPEENISTTSLSVQNKEEERDDDQNNDQEVQEVAKLKSQLESLRVQLFNTKLFVQTETEQQDDTFEIMQFMREGNQNRLDSKSIATSNTELDDSRREILQFLKEDYKRLIGIKLVFCAALRDKGRLKKEVKWLKEEVELIEGEVNLEGSVQFLKHSITSLLEESSYFGYASTESCDDDQTFSRLRAEIEYLREKLFNTAVFAPLAIEPDDSSFEQIETLQFLREEYKRLTEKRIALLTAAQDEECLVKEAARLQKELNEADNIIHENEGNEFDSSPAITLLLSMQFLKRSTRVLLRESRQLERSMSDESFRVEK